MWFVRALGGALLWILGAVVGLVGLVLCVTILLLPLGIPVLALAGRMMGAGVRMMLPHAVAHPVDELRQAGRDMKDQGAHTTDAVRKHSRKARRKLRKKIA
jgi:zinc transporter ZupT